MSGRGAQGHTAPICFLFPMKMAFNEKLCSRNKLLPFEALSPNVTFEGFVEGNNLCFYIFLYVNFALLFIAKNEKFKPILFSLMLR